MSINWVMTSPEGSGFVKLPNERILHTSPQRTSLQISTPNNYPAAQPYSAKSDSGVVYITNQRIVYLPSNPTPELQSFSSPLLNLQDTYVRAPFFGANYWTGLCKPVPEGGIPPTNPAVELRLTFKEGGAFDFHTIFEQIKERVHQSYTVSRESGQQGAAGAADVHLEQLPAYEPAEGQNAPVPEVAREEEPAIISPIPIRPTERNNSRADVGSSTEPSVPAPDEPPPGYEEVQADAVGFGLARRLTEQAEQSDRQL